jgi:hypothetical protein
MSWIIILIGIKSLWVYKYVKVNEIVHLKYIQFILCQLYLNRAVFLMSGVIISSSWEPYTAAFFPTAPMHQSRLLLLLAALLGSFFCNNPTSYPCLSMYIPFVLDFMFTFHRLFP